VPVLFQVDQARNRLKQVKNVVLVGSGKGGVGKSLVASGLAIELSSMGLATALLDIDVHGASLPFYVGAGAPVRSGRDGLEPKLAGKLKTMSVGFFTGRNPAPLKGGEKQTLITQLMALTNWGDLDFLVVDLPPGTGDELLAAFRLFSSNCRLLLVTTPSKLATEIVSRLEKLAKQEGVPVLGVVLNMSYVAVGKRRVYPLGKAVPGLLEKELQCSVLAEIPFVPKMNEKNLHATLESERALAQAFRKLAKKVAR
jgi:ATP-binding protein involved in chromosome partitioning